MSFNPSQPRDQDGKWADTGGSRSKPRAGRDYPIERAGLVERSRAMNHRRANAVAKLRKQAGLDHFGVGSPEAKAKYERLKAKTKLDKNFPKGTTEGGGFKSWGNQTPWHNK